MKNKDVIAFSIPNDGIINSIGRVQLSKTLYNPHLLIWGTDLIDVTSNKKKMILDTNSSLYYYSLSNFEKYNLVISFNASARLRRFFEKYCSKNVLTN